MPEKLKVGIVGTGKFAGCHVNVWQNIDSVKLTGAYGSNPGRLKSFSNKFDIQAFDSYEGLINNCDVIDIVSANYTHCDYAVPALINGKYPIVEKPLDISYEKAEHLYRISQEKMIHGSVVSQLRFQETYRELKDILQSGELGSVDTCRVVVIWPRSDNYFQGSGGWRKDSSLSGGGVLLHQCIHFIDLLHWFFGKVKSVNGRMGYDMINPGKESINPVENTFWGELEFTSGTTCQLYLSTRKHPYSVNTFEFLGSAGSLLSNGHYIFKNLTNNPIRDSLIKLMSYSKKVFKEPENSNTLLRRQFMNIVKSIPSNSKPAVTLKDGLLALNTAIKLYQSDKSGSRVLINN